jgi:hypothetical protein
MGGLGNQLFQIFTTLAYGFQERVKIVFPYTEVLTTGAVRPTYWTNFLNRMIPFTAGFNQKNPTNQDISSWQRIKESTFSFNDLPKLPESMNFILVGYWQSYKYFDKVKDNIFKLLQLNEMREYVINENTHYFQNSEIPVDSISPTVSIKTISMHFRLGDYKNNPECHPILSKEYYLNALNKIKYIVSTNNSEYINSQETHYKVLYFCEAEDNESVLETINFLKMLFEDTIFIKVEDTIPDWKQLLLMSACDYNIIANSSFSWWSAYMNIKENKIVCYPDIWFGPKTIGSISHDEFVKDMYPEDWIRVSTSDNDNNSI